MIIGEAPGLYEDQAGKPFVGPAGQLLDKIFRGVGWDTNRDWYITNTVKCRPAAPEGSGKQNLTPQASHRARCRAILNQEIKLVDPHTILLLGASAVQGVLDSRQPMAECVGNVFVKEEWPTVQFFVMYHPAYLLRKQKMNPSEWESLRRETWNHINILRQLVLEQEMP